MIEENNFKSRPVITRYGSAHLFLKDLFTHYKKTSRFSLRQQVRLSKGCSAALITQVLAGNRRLTRDRLPVFAKIFKLAPFETKFIDQLISKGRHTGAVASTISQPRNSILQTWSHLYVKDLVHLKGFSLIPETLSRMLGGWIPIKRIRNSVAFLLREGYLRRLSDSNQIVPDETILTSTNEIPNEKIKAFHQRALKFALKGLESFAISERKASTTLLSINQEHLGELRSMLDSFQSQLLKFIEDHPRGQDRLLQIIIHLTPIAHSLEIKK